MIEPALAAGRAVITDRYIDSSLAYQGAGRQLNRQEIARISGWATTGLRPHLTVVLDIDPAASASRALGRSAADRLEAEDEAFRTAVREQFLDLSLLDSDRYLVVDASADPEEVTRRIVERLRLVPEYERAVGAARKDAAMAHSDRADRVSTGRRRRRERLRPARRPGAVGGAAVGGGPGRAHRARLPAGRAARIGPFGRRDRVRRGTAVRDPHRLRGVRRAAAPRWPAAIPT